MSHAVKILLNHQMNVQLQFKILNIKNSMTFNYNLTLKLEKWDSLDSYLDKRINIITIQLNSKMTKFNSEEWWKVKIILFQPQKLIKYYLIHGTTFNYWLLKQYSKLDLERKLIQLILKNMELWKMFLKERMLTLKMDINQYSLMEF